MTSLDGHDARNNLAEILFVQGFGDVEIAGKHVRHGEKIGTIDARLPRDSNSRDRAGDLQEQLWVERWEAVLVSHRSSETTGSHHFLQLVDVVGVVASDGLDVSEDGLVVACLGERIQSAVSQRFGEQCKLEVFL